MEVGAVQGSQAVPSTGHQQSTSQNGVLQSVVARESEIVSSAALQEHRSTQNSQQQADTVQLKSSAIAKNLDTVRAIEQMHSRLNELVKGVRQTNENLNKAVETVAQMQGSLMAIVKNYPPYPIDSMERRELLMSYMSLRKEIESLMVPPPPQPVYEKVKSMWEAMFAQNGQLRAGSVPALDTSAGDKQVQQGAESLGRFSDQLGNMSDLITQALIKS